MLSKCSKTYSRWLASALVLWLLAGSARGQSLDPDLSLVIRPDSLGEYWLLEVHHRTLQPQALSGEQGLSIALIESAPRPRPIVIRLQDYLEGDLLVCTKTVRFKRLGGDEEGVHPSAVGLHRAGTGNQPKSSWDHHLAPGQSQALRFGGPADWEAFSWYSAELRQLSTEIDDGRGGYITVTLEGRAPSQKALEARYGGWEPLVFEHASAWGRLPAKPGERVGITILEAPALGQDVQLTQDGLILHMGKDLQRADIPQAWRERLSRLSVAMVYLWLRDLQSGKAAEVAAEWFVEGLPQYYGQLMMVRQQHRLPQDFFERIAQAEQQQSSLLHVLALDVYIRTQYSPLRLEDLLRGLYIRYQGMPLNNSILQQALAGVLEEEGGSLAFFENYILGDEPIPLTQWLDQLGLAWHETAEGRRLDFAEAVGQRASSQQIELRDDWLQSALTLPGHD